MRPALKTRVFLFIDSDMMLSRGPGILEANRRGAFIMKKAKVLPGLKRCSKCGEYKGVVKEKDLPRENHWFKTGHPNRGIEVTCICEGMKCRTCGKVYVHRVCSYYYDEKTRSLWHVPGFIVWHQICAECDDKKKMKAR